MPLLLDNREVEELLSMSTCLEAMEEAYRELGSGNALNRPRSDMYAYTNTPDVYYMFKTMDGVIPSRRIAALRIDSNLIRWREVGGKMRKEGVPAASGNRYLGLVLLFSTESGELLAIMPDGYMQRMRVGATNGLAAKYLARPDASSIGLFGSGWQAGAQLMAMCCVRNIRSIKVYSPNSEHRCRFAAEMTDLLGVEVVPVDEPEKAAEGADILVAATNSLQPVIRPEWVREGNFVTCVKYIELGQPVLEKCDAVFINSRKAAPESYVPGHGKVEIHDPIRLLKGGTEVLHEVREWGVPDWNSFPELQDLVAGTVAGRRDEGQITCFVNNIGLGIQFAAAGAVVYELARQRGVGKELPSDWFLQSLHP